MVTVKGNFETLSGSGTGYVVISLINYGNNVPRVSGTGVIINPLYQSASGSSFSVNLWGNDVITPSNTYYQVDFYTGQTTFIATGVYQFFGSSTYDLSTTAPIIVTPTLPLGYSTVTVPATVLIASGTVDGVNTNFTFTAPASPTPNIAVYSAGMLQVPGASGNYNLAYSGSNTWTIAFTSGNAPGVGVVQVIIFS